MSAVGGVSCPVDEYDYGGMYRMGEWSGSGSMCGSEKWEVSWLGCNIMGLSFGAASKQRRGSYLHFPTRTL